MLEPNFTYFLLLSVCSADSLRRSKYLLQQASVAFYYLSVSFFSVQRIHTLKAALQGIKIKTLLLISSLDLLVYSVKNVTVSHSRSEKVHLLVIPL